MRTVLTKILTNQQTFKELCMGKFLTVSSVVYGVMIIVGIHVGIQNIFCQSQVIVFDWLK